MARRLFPCLLTLLAVTHASPVEAPSAEPLSVADCAVLGAIASKTKIGPDQAGAYVLDYPFFPEGTVFNPPRPPPPTQAELAVSLRRMLPSLTRRAALDYAGEIVRLREAPYRVRCDWARYGRAYWIDSRDFEVDPGWKSIPGAPPPPPPPFIENTVEVDRPVYRQSGRYALASIRSFPMGGRYEGVVCQLQRHGLGWRVMACGIEPAQ